MPEQYSYLNELFSNNNNIPGRDIEIGRDKKGNPETIRHCCFYLGHPGYLDCNYLADDNSNSETDGAGSSIENSPGGGECCRKSSLSSYQLPEPKITRQEEETVTSLPYLNLLLCNYN